MKLAKTKRGFSIIEFKDYNGEKCSLQKSSLAEVDCIWLGIDDADPKIMASQAPYFGVETNGETTGWVEYPIPKEVLLSTRMHLNRKQAAELIEVLQVFVDTGDLPDGEKIPTDKPVLEVADAMQALAKAIHEDEDYRLGWVANLTMAYLDSFNNELEPREMARNAAERFLSWAFKKEEEQ